MVAFINSEWRTPNRAQMRAIARRLRAAERSVLNDFSWTTAGPEDYWSTVHEKLDELANEAERKAGLSKKVA